MILEKNNLQTAREWNKSYIELIALYVHPKHGNHLRSHLRAIMALDHHRLIRPGNKKKQKQKKKQGEFFLLSRILLYKILPTNLSARKPSFYTICTSQLRWNSTMRHCFYHTDHGQIFHNFAIQNTICTNSMFRTIEARMGFRLNRFKKFPKSRIRPAGSHFCSESCGRVFEWTLIENKETL